MCHGDGASGPSGAGQTGEGREKKVVGQGRGGRKRKKGPEREEQRQRASRKREWLMSSLCSMRRGELSGGKKSRGQRGRDVGWAAMRPQEERVQNLAGRPLRSDRVGWTLLSVPWAGRRRTACESVAAHDIRFTRWPLRIDAGPVGRGERCAVSVVCRQYHRPLFTCMAMGASVGDGRRHLHHL